MPHSKRCGCEDRHARTRCCNGRIRTIYDCCAYTATRINGDGAVTGYCYSGKKVFCIGYRDTNIRC
jgi:hypothetical protein